MRRFVVAKWSDVPEDCSRTIRLAGYEIALIKLKGGHLYALENRLLEGENLSDGTIIGRYIVDSQKSWKIDVTSGKLEIPVERMIRTFPVEVNADTGLIIISLEEDSLSA